MSTAHLALAADYYVDITNRDRLHDHVYVCEPGEIGFWEEDVLGDNVLPSGKTQRVNLTGCKSPIFEIRLVDEDGDKYTFWNVDVSTDDIVVTLDDLDDYQERTARPPGTVGRPGEPRHPCANLRTRRIFPACAAAVPRGL